ncbi:hypothetical protein EDB87DRAFT_1689269 [Lactarius vividus]|nr:hypothetical protein EDB87DRAFT_1689269 [Lactarius vividus]
MSLAGINLGPHAAEYVYLNSITNLPPLAILYYDYLLTLPLEIQYLWYPNKLGWFTIACLLNRYLPVLGHIPLAVSYMVRSDDLLWAMIGSRRAKVETIQVISSVAGCNQYMPREGGRYAALTWLGVLMFDTTIFSLTLYKAIRMGRGIRLLDVIVRDGAMYYSALFVVNLTNILILLFAPPLLKNSTTSITNVLSITLVSRLMLNLRAQSTTQPGLPTSIESERRFQAALPTPPRPPMTGSGRHVATRSNKTTWETAPVGTADHVDVVQPSKHAGKTWASAGERT